MQMFLCDVFGEAFADDGHPTVAAWPDASNFPFCVCISVNLRAMVMIEVLFHCLIRP